MLNNLLLFAEGDFDFVMVAAIFIFVFILIVFGAISSFAKKQNGKNETPLSVEKVKSTEASRAALKESLKNKFAAKSGISPSYSSITLKNDHGHDHYSTEVESYDEISGSLGSVNDEGCFELIGKRLISNDESYDIESGEIDYNLEDIGLTMILGEVLENPKFKSQGQGRTVK